MSRVLVVDDDPQVRTIVRTVLERHGYDCRAAGSAIEAREQLASEEVELVLSDVTMPGESGIDLARHLRSSHPEVAVLMMSAIDDPAVADRAVELGVHGYIVKPFNISQLLIGVSSALRMHDLDRSRARESTLELRRSREDTLRRLARAAQFRDGETGRHIERMGEYCGAIARKLGIEPERAELLRLAGPLHDVGKIAVPDWILLKPGPLSEDERALMEKHGEVGFLILSGSQEELLELAASMALTHHERLDGSGYPNGLAGPDISLEGRIAAVADVYDALTSDRVYRPRFSKQDADAHLEAGRGTLYDSEVVDALLAAAAEEAA
jgi:putative two-component system response regulator